jgi:hypothetical protein
MPQTIEKILIKIPGISPLTFEDEIMLRDVFSKNSVHYSQSFLYLLRASHSENGSLGYKYIDKEIKAIIGYRKTMIYLTPLKDSTQGQKLQQLCEELTQKTGCRILLKKFSQKKYPKLKNIQRADSTNDMLEDDTYPETILNLPKLFITPEGTVNRKAKRFFRKVKRFKKLNMHLDIIDDLSLVPLKNVDTFLKRDEKKYASFHPIITYLYIHGQNNKYQITIFLYKNRVQALYIVEKFSSTQAGLYCGVTAKNKPGITEWMDHFVFQEMFFEGIKTVYLGGSENAGIYYFVNKLLPEKPKYFVQTMEYKPTK